MDIAAYEPLAVNSVRFIAIVAIIGLIAIAGLLSLIDDSSSESEE